MATLGGSDGSVNNVREGLVSLSTVERDRLVRMEDAVLAAARYLLVAMTRPDQVEVRRKPDKSLVMNLDIESQRIITLSLAGTLPVVGEEDSANHELLGKREDYFLVDPIDGTSSCKRFLSQEGQQGGQLGFGPLIGWVERGHLIGATFYHVPQRTLFSAMRGAGVSLVKLDPLAAVRPAAFEERTFLKAAAPSTLSESIVLFYPGPKGELRFLEYLKVRGLIENAYRFGGFANDCTRLAQGLEQIQVEFQPKAWDFSAALFNLEAGLEIVVDPAGEASPVQDWVVQYEAPILSAGPAVMPELLRLFQLWGAACLP